MTKIPARLREKIHSVLSVILSGSGNGFDSVSGIQLVFTKLFHKLLFSPNGLWVRTTLALMQEFIGKRLTLLGAVVKDKTVLERDYESFIDFVLMSKGSSGLAKEHYLSIAKATAIESIADIFKNFPIKQLIHKDILKVVNFHIGTHQSTFFFTGTQS